jgi:hypothetical protein
LRLGKNITARKRRSKKGGKRRRRRSKPCKVYNGKKEEE